jgi:hypothetical protein
MRQLLADPKANLVILAHFNVDYLAIVHPSLWLTRPTRRFAMLFRLAVL